MAPVLSDITQGSRLSSVAAGPVVIHEVRYAPGHFMPPHAHRRANITLVLAGGQTDEVEEGLCECAPLSVIFKPSGAEHATRISARGLRTCVFELDQTCERLLRRRWGLFERCIWVHAGPLSLSLIGLWASLRSGRDAPERLVGAWLASLPPAAVERALRAAAESPECEALLAAERILREHHGTGAGTANLGGRLGMHPTSVTRLFKRRLGHGVMAQVRHLRVRDAADRLAGADDPIALVAIRAGFADQSHLTRDFRRETGLTPAAFRRFARPGRPAGVPSAAA